MLNCLLILAAEMTSDFKVRAVKPYATQATWIMSEKYQGIRITFTVHYEGRPGYLDVTDGSKLKYVARSPASSCEIIDHILTGH